MTYLAVEALLFPADDLHVTALQKIQLLLRVFSFRYYFGSIRQDGTICTQSETFWPQNHWDWCSHSVSGI